MSTVNAPTPKSLGEEAYDLYTQEGGQTDARRWENLPQELQHAWHRVGTGIAAKAFRDLVSSLRVTLASIETHANHAEDAFRPPEKRSTARHAPWTPEQVECLQAFQTSKFVHPFTGESGPNGEETVLIPTTEGWHAEVGGPVVQTWAHDFMLVWKDPNTSPGLNNLEAFMEMMQQQVGEATPATE